MCPDLYHYATASGHVGILHTTWAAQHGTKKMMTSPRRYNGNYGHRQVILARRRVNGINRRRNVKGKYSLYMQ